MTTSTNSERPESRQECRSHREAEAEQSWRRGFWSLIVTQFQGAFSDNALKQLAIFIGISLGLSQIQRDQLVSKATALLTLPFILFSMAGGFLANRYSKRTVTIGIKVFEIGVMTLATVGLVSGSLNLVLGCVFLMGVHSAIFGPSKYGSLPEQLPERRLSWGNGVLELGTFLAIILGTVVGAMLSQRFEKAPIWAGIILVGLAVCGLGTSLGMGRVAPADPTKKFRLNFVGDLWEQIQLIRKDRVLFLAVIGNNYFWFLAVLLSQNVIIYGLDVLRVDQTHNGYLQAAIGIGIGVGSLAAGYLSGGKIEYGLIPLGSLGITVCAALLALPGTHVRKGGPGTGRARVLCRFLCRAGQRHHATSPAQGRQGRRARRAEPDVERLRVSGGRRVLS